MTPRNACLDRCRFAIPVCGRARQHPVGRMGGIWRIVIRLKPGSVRWQQGKYRVSDALSPVLPALAHCRTALATNGLVTSAMLKTMCRSARTAEPSLTARHDAGRTRAARKVATACVKAIRVARGDRPRMSHRRQSAMQKRSEPAQGRTAYAQRFAAPCKRRIAVLLLGILRGPDFWTYRLLRPNRQALRGQHPNTGLAKLSMRQPAGVRRALMV